MCSSRIITVEARSSLLCTHVQVVTVGDIHTFYRDAAEVERSARCELSRIAQINGNDGEFTEARLPTYIFIVVLVWPRYRS